MSNKWTKMGAAAAVTLIVAGAAFVFLHQSVSPAYAIEQTIEANRTLRYIHVREDMGQGFNETWAQLDDEGRLVRLRMNFPHSEDGPKDVIWEANKAQVWFKAKKSVAVVSEPDLLERIPQFFEVSDPNVVTRALYDAQAKGTVQVATIPGKTAQDPIVLVATTVPGVERRDIYQIDPATRLVRRVEKYRLIEGEYVYQTSYDYLEYNQEPDPATFELGAPADVMRIDETTQVIGLPKADLTDSQITVQIARDFFEALIAQDFGKAGQLLSGVPASKVQELMGTDRVKFVRIVSVGEPEPQPIPGVGGTQVECQIEVEQDGVKSIKRYVPAVRPVYSHPDHWNIHGMDGI